MRGQKREQLLTPLAIRRVAVQWRKDSWPYEFFWILICRTFFMIRRKCALSAELKVTTFTRFFRFIPQL